MYVAIGESQAQAAVNKKDQLPEPCDREISVEDGESLEHFLQNAEQQLRSSGERLNRHHLYNGDHVTCIRWYDSFFITGTDIVKIIYVRMKIAGKEIFNQKKFEEGIFSDLRSLKVGQGCVLEEPKSEFLEYLHRNSCIRTQKKQKVFYWNAVDYRRLFCDAVDRLNKQSKSPNAPLKGTPTSKYQARPKYCSPASTGALAHSLPVAIPQVAPKAQSFTGSAFLSQLAEDQCFATSPSKIFLNNGEFSRAFGVDLFQIQPNVSFELSDTRDSLQYSRILDDELRREFDELFFKGNALLPQEGGVPSK